jgi:predicted heme/steroid binding protein
MAKLSFDEADLCSLDLHDLNAFERSNLDDWYSKFKDFKCYPIVGKISTPMPFRDFTLAELLTYKECTDIPEGRIDAPILMGINGKVIDVSYGGKEMYGKGGPYFLFAGIDASKALAKMSFDVENLTSRDLSDLTPAQQKTLADWEKKFIVSRKYPVVGKIVT